MDQQQREEIAARLAAADLPKLRADHRGERIALYAHPGGGRVFIGAFGERDWAPNGRARAEAFAALFVHAAGDLAALLGEVEQLERRVAALEADQATLRAQAAEALRVYDDEALEEHGAGSEGLFAAMVQLQAALSADAPGAPLLAAQEAERAAMARAERAEEDLAGVREALSGLESIARALIGKKTISSSNAAILRSFIRQAQRALEVTAQPGAEGEAANEGAAEQSASSAGAREEGSDA
jgi:hypothetical protein